MPVSDKAIFSVFPSRLIFAEEFIPKTTEFTVRVAFLCGFSADLTFNVYAEKLRQHNWL